MSIHVAKWLLFVAGVAVAACQTGPLVITKSAQSDELQKETTVGVELPAGCPRLTKVLPAGKTTFNVDYREPETNQSGNFANLAYTTIYVRSSDGQTKAIRILSDNPHGGAFVKVVDIPLSGSKIELCITGTNRYGKEGQPGP